MHHWFTIEDEIPFVEDDEISNYQMLIACLNWTITLDRNDFHFSMSELAGYSHCPTILYTARWGLEVFGYLMAYSKEGIEVDPEHLTPQQEKQQYDWTAF